MDIVSYVKVNNLKFGSNEEEAITEFGNPITQRLNNDNEKEYHYDGFIIRFDSESKLFRECTLLPGCVANLNGNPIEWDLRCFSDLLKRDGDPKEAFGFILLLKLGVAMSGFHDKDESQKAIHIFSKGDWDDFIPSMREFVF